MSIIVALSPIPIIKEFVSFYKRLCLLEESLHVFRDNRNKRLIVKKKLSHKHHLNAHKLFLSPTRSQNVSSIIF